MEGFAILLVIVVGATAIAVGYSVNQRRQVVEAWREAAARRHLLFREGDFVTEPEIVGTVRGHRLTVRVARRGSDGSTKYTRYRVEYREPLPADLRITTAHDGFFANMRRAMAGGDIETGDSEFDSRLRVTGSEPEQIRVFLTQPRRRALIRACERHPGIEITHRQLSWDVRDLELNPHVIVGTLDALLDTAADLCDEVGELDEAAGASLGTSRITRAVRPREQSHAPSSSSEDGGRRDPRLRRLPAEPRETPIETAPHMPRAEATPASKNETGGSDRERAARPETARPEQRGRHGPPTVARPLPRKPQTTAPVADDVVRDVTTLDDSAIAAVCVTVFDEKATSADAARRFAEQYCDAIVGWSGRLASVARYPFDRIFGRGPGCRAEFIVHRMERPFGPRDVRAVVQLPEGAERELRRLVGKGLAFGGRLMAYDRFMQTLYLADGSMAPHPGSGTPAR